MQWGRKAAGNLRSLPFIHKSIIAQQKPPRIFRPNVCFHRHEKLANINMPEASREVQWRLLTAQAGESGSFHLHKTQLGAISRAVLRIDFSTALHEEPTNVHVTMTCGAVQCSHPGHVGVPPENFADDGGVTCDVVSDKNEIAFLCCVDHVGFACNACVGIGLHAARASVLGRLGPCGKMLRVKVMDLTRNSSRVCCKTCKLQRSMKITNSSTCSCETRQANAPGISCSGNP